MDLREVLRHLQTTTNLSAIQRATGLNRRTLMRYRSWATEQGLLAGPLPPPEELQRLVEETLAPPAPPQTLSTVAPYRDVVLDLHARGVSRGPPSSSDWGSAVTSAASPPSTVSSTSATRLSRTPPCAWSVRRAPRRRSTSATRAICWTTLTGSAAGRGRS